MTKKVRRNTIWIIPGPEATEYTRLALQRFGPAFVVRDEGCPAAFEKTPCLLVNALYSRWAGWLPIDEILVNGGQTQTYFIEE